MQDELFLNVDGQTSDGRAVAEVRGGAKTWNTAEIKGFDDEELMVQ